MIENSTNPIKSKIQKPKVIAVVGPTASGKSAYAVELAKQVNGEVISADSRLVYKGFNITCAKPTEEEMQGIPHYMMDIVTPDVDYSAGLYAKQAKDYIYDILGRGKVPIIVGGTGLYFRLLLESYVMPEVKPNNEFREKLRSFPVEDLYKKLCELDAESASTIDANDKKKIIRALEILKFTGRPLSEVRGIKSEKEFDIHWIGRNYPREELYQRINERVDIMVEHGMVEETQGLLQRYGRVQNLVCTIGYQEIISYLDGVLSFNEAIERLKQNTRRYAKRQLTWFRRNPDIQWNCYPEPLRK